MASVCEEVEIEIEFAESFESDPLSENVEDKGIRKSNEDTDRYKNFEEDSDESSSYNNTEENTCYDVDYADKIINEEATWYKEIDRSGRYLCKFCELTYSTVQTLRHHVKKKHPDEALKLKIAILNNKRNSKLKCHICKTRFKLLTDLKDHLQHKHEVESVATSCKHCNATFLNRKDMLEHLYLNHETLKEKTFFCTICGYRTLKKSHFKQHRNTHIKEKNIKCNYCDYSTNYLPNLNIHERIHSNIKLYVCDYVGCDYRSSTKSALRSHRLKHNREDNLLYCDKCSYETVYKQSLRKHIDSHMRSNIR